MINYRQNKQEILMLYTPNEIVDLYLKQCIVSDKQKEEIERLNNIINEFDKWLLGEKMMFYKSSDGETLIRFNETTSKWLELKGEDDKE